MLTNTALIEKALNVCVNMRTLMFAWSVTTNNAVIPVSSKNDILPPSDIEMFSKQRKTTEVMTND